MCAINKTRFTIRGRYFVPWMPEVFSLASGEERPSERVVISDSASRLRRSILSPPMRKPTGTQGRYFVDYLTIFRAKKEILSLWDQYI